MADGPAERSEQRRRRGDRPICYLERRGGVFYHALAAWAPPAEHPAEAARCPGIALRIRTSSPLEA
ncbi:hypothetical protein ACH4LS_12485 [Streptomyces luteogriseus]|uniref:hypothetical protein n=1 Tax=Streptomyces luteogriseus TaxID=68233 RepID=UPI0037AE7781